MTLNKHCFNNGIKVKLLLSFYGVYGTNFRSLKHCIRGGIGVAHHMRQSVGAYFKHLRTHLNTHTATDAILIYICFHVHLSYLLFLILFTLLNETKLFSLNLYK